MDATSIAAVLGKLNQEVFVLTAADRDRRSGQIATWVMPATIIPQVPRLLVGVGRLTYTRELIEASRRFALNLLGQDQWRWVPTSASSRDGMWTSLPQSPSSVGSPAALSSPGS